MKNIRRVIIPSLIYFFEKRSVLNNTEYPVKYQYPLFQKQNSIKKTLSRKKNNSYYCIADSICSMR